MALSESDYLKSANDEYVGRLQARNRIILNFITVSTALIADQELATASEDGFWEAQRQANNATFAAVDALGKLVRQPPSA